MKKIKLILGLAASLFTMTGCYDLDVYPEDQLSTGTFFKTKDHADQAMMGVYSLLRDQNAFGWQFSYDCLGGISAGYDNPSLQVIAKGTYTTTTGVIGGKFKTLYEGISRANIVLQNVDNCNMSDEDKARYKGEAKFMRALFYFSLLDFYGGVPIYDENTVVAEDFMNMLKPRSSAEEVRKFILADLDEAASVLPEKWDELNHGRATSGSATALKGKVLLYNKQYADAQKCFEKVVNSGLYELYDDYADLFKPGGDDSSEMIFAIQNMGGIGTDFGMPMCFYMGSRSSYGSCWNNVMVETNFVDSYEYKDGRPFDWEEVMPGYTTSDQVKKDFWYSTPNSAKNKVEKYTPYRDQILAMYEARDPRMNASIILPYTLYKGWVNNAPKICEFALVGKQLHEKDGYVRINHNEESYLWRKFVPEHNMDGALTNRAHTPINFPLIRLADVYLMLAECLNEAGNQDKAVEYINKVRERAGIALLNDGKSWNEARSKSEVFKRIVHERRVELACEGLSFSDMKRWGMLETLNGKVVGLAGKFMYNRLAEERDYLWPMPQEEMDINESLEQNPGW